MVETKITGSQAIEIIGKEIYGDEFSLSNEKTKKVYKLVYEIFKKSFLGKKNKGVLIIGDIGVGKTAMMRIFQRLLKDTERRFKWVNGYDLKDLSELQTSLEIKAIYGANLKCDLYIDDIGFSFDTKRFGNTVNIITEILMVRYELFITSGFKTHLSSNLVTAIKNNTENLPTLEKVYGNRVLDRVKEMCDLITWKGESLRK